jgi:hypothetical protein
MKKPPFNTYKPKTFEKVHSPNKIEINLQALEKENIKNTLEEFNKMIPNLRKL